MNKKWIVLPEIRKLQNISQDTVAGNLGVNRVSIARLEAGIPALAQHYKERICDMLQINREFLFGEDKYPFVPNAFIKFYVKSLSYRLRPMAWFDLLLRYTEKIDMLLLLGLLRRKKKGNVVAVCIKDDRGSVFLISIDVPLKWETAMNCIKEHTDKGVKVNVTTKYFSDLETIMEKYLNDLIAGVKPRKLFSYLEDKSKKEIEEVIDEAFSDESSTKYGFIVGRERINMHMEDICIFDIPIRRFLADTLKCLKYSEDEKFKADIVRSVVEFYRAGFLKDFTENGFKDCFKDLQRAFENFRIPPSVRQAHGEDRPHKDKSNK